jgi:membrane protease YdiL (CAAX protease family)
MEDSATSRPIATNGGQIVAWVILLFALTLLGALPLLIQGINLKGISSSTRYLPLILTGMLVTSCSPTLAALVVTGLYPRAGGIRCVTHQVRRWRISFVWYAIALGGPIVLLLAAEAVSAVAHGAIPARWMIQPSFSGPGGLPFVIFGSLLAEEPGWRGFAQPRLQMRGGALAASILIGLLWSTWHLWYVILPGGFSNVTGTDAVATYVRLTSTAVVYAWMYNSTDGSLLIAMLAHLGHNLATSLIPAVSDGGRQHLVNALAYLVTGVVVVVITEPQTLRRRKRLDMSARQTSKP